MPRIRAILVLSLVATVACSPARGSAGGEARRTLPTSDSLSAFGGAFWYTTHRVGQPAQLHTGSDGVVVGHGERFELSSDGALVAIQIRDQLEVRPVTGGRGVQIAFPIADFAWRPGAHDLLYLVRDREHPRLAAWRMRKAGGDDSVVAEATYESLATAKVSPDGQWLAYYFGGQIKLLPLAEQTSRSVTLGPSDLLGEPAWASAGHLSVIDGNKLVLIDAVSGKRQTFAQADVDWTGADPVWTSDGKWVAMQYTNGFAVFGEHAEPLICQGPWAPINWSPDGHFLALNHGDNANTLTLHILDLHKNARDCSPEMLPEMYSIEAWNPNGNMVIAKGRPANGRKDGALQVWEVTDRGVKLDQVVPEGSNARWLAPKD